MKKPPLKKRILKHPATRWVLCAVMAGLIRLTYATSRVVQEMDGDTVPYANGKKNAIFAFWHGRLMMMPAFRPPGRAMNVLISQHNDGTLIANTMHLFGINTVRGSSSRGAAPAAMELLTAMEAGDNVSITPDGPRGPFQQADKGVVQLAKLSGLPVIPVSYSISRHRRLRSWDKFMIALPFARMSLIAAAPITVPRDASDEVLESKRLELEHCLTAITERADMMIGSA